MSHPPLETDHNVYILGAGFSVSAGFPVVRDFLSMTRETVDWLEQNNRTVELQAVERVLTYRHRVAGAAYRTTVDPDNVEELFSLASADDRTMVRDMRLAMGATLDYCRLRAAPSFVADLVLAPEAAARKELVDSHWPLSRGKELGYADGYDAIRIPAYQGLVGALAGRMSSSSPSRRTTFITFNYDLVVEEAIAAGGLSADYGIAPSGLTNEAKYLRRDCGLKLLKLHGSVNWALPGKKGKRMTAYANYDEVVKRGLAPVLVPPTWRKEFTGQLAAVWDQALLALRTATRVIVIGFSMPLTDQHFRYLLAAGLRENISLRQVVFVDPGAAAVRERALAFLRAELESRGSLKFESIRALELLHGERLQALGRPLAPGIEIMRRF